MFVGPRAVFQPTQADFIRRFRFGKNLNRLLILPSVFPIPDGTQQMIEYPFVFYHWCARYMSYNGNHYEKTGVHLAVLN